MRPPSRINTTYLATVAAAALATEASPKPSGLSAFAPTKGARKVRPTHRGAIGQHAAMTVLVERVAVSSKMYVVPRCAIPVGLLT